MLFRTPVSPSFKKNLRGHFPVIANLTRFIPIPGVAAVWSRLTLVSKPRRAETENRDSVKEALESFRWYMGWECELKRVGAKEHPVYGGGRYRMNIDFLRHCCLVKKGCCLVKKGLGLGLGFILTLTLTVTDIKT